MIRGTTEGSTGSSRLSGGNRGKEISGSVSLAQVFLAITLSAVAMIVADIVLHYTIGDGQLTVFLIIVVDAGFSAIAGLWSWSRAKK